MSEGVIKHDGEVVAVAPKGLKVKVESRSACAACHAKGLCTASDTKDKFIYVKKEWLPVGAEFAVGDKVTLEMRAALGLKAVWIVYAVPVVIFVTILLYLQSIKASELKMGLAVIVALTGYFLLLYLFRGKIGRSFRFYVTKENKLYI